MDNFIDQMPKIIRESAKSPLGILALAIAVLSLIGVLFFREASVDVRIAIFALMFAGFAGFVLLAFTRYRPGEASEGKTKEIRRTEQSEKGDLRAKADGRYKDAEKSRISGRNDQARSAYEEAHTLYKHEQNRLGEANVLLGLGHLESMLGRNDRARPDYGEARTLFKQVGDRLGEANVLSGLGELEAEAEPELAKQHLYQAANLYESIGLEEQKRTALDEAAKLGR